MQLVIAEKPSVARDIARVLGVRGSGKHSIASGARVITWCIGHLVELEEPASYDSRWKPWRLEALPMIPGTFKLRPVESTRAQLDEVRRLLRDRRFEEVINACDAGREGELIFRYVYELAGSRLPARRLWISSMTDESIRRGFETLRPDVDCSALADAARCRSEADWLVGMNATRAVTITRRGTGRGQRGAAGGFGPRAATYPARPASSRGGEKSGRDVLSPVYSIGRVQTPTLGIVVRREQAIAGFRPRDYWEVRGTFVAGSGASACPPFDAEWGFEAEPGKGRVGRLGTASMAEEIVARAAALATRATAPPGSRAAGGAGIADRAGAVVESILQKKSREVAPQLFDLTSLQRTANRRFGLSATRTLELAQALYEKHKLLTYPRTDSRNLTTDLIDEMPRLFRAAGEIPDYAPFAQALLRMPPPRSRRVFDDGKVHDHHAIIPTGKAGAGTLALSPDEAKVFDLVMRRFLGVFYPDAEFALTDVVIRVGGPPAPADLDAPAARDLSPVTGSDTAAANDEAVLGAVPPPPDRFHARGRVRLVAGWQEVAQIGGEPERARRTNARREPELDGEGTSMLPSLVEGQLLEGTFDALAKQTKPPPHHTEASLLGAMESAGREIEDESLRLAMKDTGLGTPATRASTIETLVKRGFIARHGKQVTATAMGIALIETLPVPSLASPELTGAWEARLARIARGQEARGLFMADIRRYVVELVDTIRSSGGSPAVTRGRHGIKPAAAGPRTDGEPSQTGLSRTLVCPRCREGALVTGKRGWGCSRWREGCAFVVWFETAGRKITQAQLRDLVQKGKTRKARWSPSGGGALAGRLVLDTTAPGRVGAGRFQPG